MDDDNELTAVGHTLAKLPLDPRVGRMILEAKSRGALDEVLVIASALSVQDVRDRPMDKQAQADQAHAKFDDEKSEFVGYLKLWKWLGDSRGGKGQPLPQPSSRGGERKPLVLLPPLLREGGGGGLPAPSHKISNRQYEQLLRENFVNIRRVREWRDIHSQLVAVVGEQGWAAAPGRPQNGQPFRAAANHVERGELGPHPLNNKPASYEQLHQSMLCGLLGNLGQKSDEEDWYLGARGIKFYRHPGAKLSKKPGRWIVAAELVETTRLFGRGIANIEPQWIEQVAGHLLKKQLLDPHWEKKAAQVTALERATLYGLVVYSGRRVNFGRVDPVAAREVFIREALVAGNWDTPLTFLKANEKLIAKVQDLEHKARRQDVLVDEELIYAFYDQQLPPDVCSGASCEAWYKEEIKKQPKLLLLTQEELMRHEAAGITTQSFPKILRLGGVDCSATYLHEPGDAKDGVTVDVPLFALNQVTEERCEWLVPGMLKDKVQALIKTLHQRPRSRLVPLPDTATRMAEQLNQPEVFGTGSLTDAVLKLVRDATAVDVKRGDLKLDMLAPHLFMNFRVVDEHGRQLGTGRSLAGLKGDLGVQARGAFQALAGLKNLAVSAHKDSKAPVLGSFEVSNEPADQQIRAQAAPKTVAPKTPERYTSWAFGELPELMEIKKGAQTLIGFPALIDLVDAVTIEVFDEPELATAKHRAGLARLFALQIKDAIKYLEKNLPDLQKMATAYMLVGRVADNSGGGTLEELRGQILEVALARTFLLDPLPTNETEFKKRLDEGRGRLTLIATEIARLAGGILLEFTAAQRKIKDTKNALEASVDAFQQLQRLVPKKFLTATPYGQLQHFPRYLKAITARLDKWRADPARDAAKMLELKPQEQRYWRLVAERKGATDARMQEFRWLLEELRVSFFAQELRTPQPVSIKRLEKVWQQLNS